MAKVVSQEAPQAQAFTKADAFLNIRIQDKNGGWHSLKKGAPIRKDEGPLQEMLIAQPDLMERLMQAGRIELTVSVDKSDEPIELF